jgi:hypothetical protein
VGDASGGAAAAGGGAGGVGGGVGGASGGGGVGVAGERGPVPPVRGVDLAAGLISMSLDPTPRLAQR